MIDSSSGYLISVDKVTTPFATTFEILVAMPFHPRDVQAWLSSNDAGSLVIKKRGITAAPEQIRKMFKLTGSREFIMALTRQGKREWAFMLRRVGERLGH